MRSNGPRPLTGRPTTIWVDSDRSHHHHRHLARAERTAALAITDYDYRFKEMIRRRLDAGDQNDDHKRRWIEIFGLQPDTVYDVEVRAKNNEGVGPWSRYEYVEDAAVADHADA